MSIIRHNINLQEQVSRTYTRTAPKTDNFNKYNASVDGSEYEEYSFTGTKEQIDEQEEIELNNASFSPVSYSVTEQKIVECGKSVTTSKTRSEGDLWTLQVKVQKIIQTLTPEGESEATATAEEQEKKFGKKEHPKIVNTSVTAIQQSILFTEPYKSMDAKKLGAIKQYMSGASEFSVVPIGMDSAGNPQNGFLKDICPMSQEVLNAMKTPVYYVPTVTVTVSYWSQTPVSSIGNVGQEQAPSGGNFQLSPGYSSVFMGASSSPVEGGGYQIQETYTIGQFDFNMLHANG